MGLRVMDILFSRLHYEELQQRAAGERLAGSARWPSRAKRSAGHYPWLALRAVFSNWAAWLRIRTNLFSSTYPATFIAFSATQEPEYEELCCQA